MNSRSIEEVYRRNDEVAERFVSLIGSLSEEQIEHLPDGEKWTIGNIAEHVSIVETGMIRICAKLLRKAEAEGKLADGTVAASDEFLEKTAEIATIKLEAPEIVQPTKERAIGESIEQLNQNRLQ